MSITAGLASGSTDPYVFACNVLQSEKDKTAVKKFAVTLMGLGLRRLNGKDSGL